MIYGDEYNVIGTFLSFTFIENPGIAFGIDFGDEYKLLITIFRIVICLAIVYYLYKISNEQFLKRFSVALVLGGAIGNLIDRLFYGLIFGYGPLCFGKVVDFIKVDFINISLFGRTYNHLPIFNIADIAVFIGVVLLLFYSGGLQNKLGNHDLEKASSV